MKASELVDSPQFGDMLEQAVESANEKQRKIMKAEPEQWEVNFVEFYNEYGKYEHRERGICAYIKFISQLLKTQHDAIISEINPVELAERIVIEYANLSGRESENREYVRQSARTVLEKTVNNLEQEI